MAAAAVITPQKPPPNVDKNIERVLVTSQKRVQALQEVPAAISVYSGKQLAQNVIADLEEMSGAMANISINEAGVSTNLFIRGVGSGVNQGFEQSVATYIDGSYFGRGRSARAALFDIERVEVLKGPQGTLFGKNAIAGALNITTRQAGDGSEDYVELLFEPGFDGRGIKAAFGGALSQTLNTRLALMNMSESGWLYNTHTGKNESEKDDLFIRSSWQWLAAAGLEIRLKIAHSRFDTKGRNSLVSLLPEDLPVYALSRAVDPQFKPAFGLSKSMGGDSVLGKELANNQGNNINLALDYASPWGALTAISSVNRYSSEEFNDVDLLPIDFLSLQSSQRHRQLSQEIRLASSIGAHVDTLVGVYWQQNDLSYIAQVGINGFTVGLPFSGTSHNRFFQDTKVSAVFAQANWTIKHQWQLNAGLRVSKESKTLFKNLTIDELGSTAANTDPVSNAVFRNALNIYPHTFSAQSHRDGVAIEFDPLRDEFSVTPSLSLQYYNKDRTMYYASVATGVKSGGFDATNGAGDADAEEYENEKAVAFEAGLKTAFAGGTRLNLSVFYNRFSNLQVSTFDGTSAFTVGNAAGAITRGIELDGRIEWSGQWRSDYSLAWLDAYYDHYPGGQCTNAKRHCNSAGFQDLSGKPLQYAPKYNGVLTFAYEDSFAGDWLIGAGVSVIVTDDFHIPGDLDPKLMQKAFTKVNARLQMGDAGERWFIALVGKNLTNRLTTSWGNDVPLAPGGFFQHLDPPRSVEIVLRWNF